MARCPVRRRRPAPSWPSSTTSPIHPDGATLTEIAAAVGADRSAFVHVLAALTTSGVLYREPDDRRYHLGPALVRPGRVAGARYGELADRASTWTGWRTSCSCTACRS